MNSNINKEIEDLILRDLANLKLAVHDKQRILEYRDKYFLNGSYDYIFLEYIRKHKLTN